MNNSNLCRLDRVEAISAWSLNGVKEARALIGAEKAFSERVKASRGCFYPIKLNDSVDLDYQREIGYLIDAFDALPMRPDFAFESVWKALESETRVYSPKETVTSRMFMLAERGDMRVLMKLAEATPLQSCKYLFKIIVTDYLIPSARANSADRGAALESKRVDSVAKKSGQLSELFDYMRQTFRASDPSSVRRGALLLRHGLRGDSVHMGEENCLCLDEEARALILIPLYLYSARNDRFHADFSSPFISGVATVRTYTLPFHAFMVAYHMLLEIWIRKRPNVVSGNVNSVIALLDQNLVYVRDLFGKHW
jgi:hypothetical protein